MNLLHLLIVASTGWAPSHAQEVSEPALDPIQAQAEQCAELLLLNESIHSVSIGIYSDGKLLSVHKGELDPGQSNVPRDDTIYAVASITKTMTGLLAARAVLDGKLQLEDDVRDYLSGDYPKLSFEGQPIRLRHLLTHTSQLPAELFGLEAYLRAGDLEGALGYAASYGKESFFKDLKSFDLRSQPGGAYLYSSTGTNLLAYVLEGAYKKPYSALLSEFVFEAAGMSDSCLELAPEQRRRLANGYDGQGTRTPEQPRLLLGADGYVKCTVTDLTRYMRFLLGAENRAAQESWRALSPGPAALGYFWLIEKRPESLFVKHAGTAIGTTTWMLLNPKQRSGVVVVISSRFPGAVELLYNAAVKLLIQM